MTMTALVVEGDESVRAGMAFALKSAHIRVIGAGTMAEGTLRFHETTIDVAVVDLHLPACMGHKFANWLLSHKPQLPLVLTSTGFYDAEQASPIPTSHRRIALLAKPFSAGFLLDAIQLACADPVDS